MKAVQVEHPGGPEALTWGDAPDPEPGPGEVVVAVAAAGVNRADLLQRRGKYPAPPGASGRLGLEVSGTVAAVGAPVGDDGEGGDGAGAGGPASAWQVGDRVCALLSGGGYAERVAVPSGQVMPVPAGVDLVDAAALPEVCATVWSTVFMTAGLRPGEVLLVHGGSSGIGTAAVQIAAAAGATVAVTASTPAKLEAARRLGAHVLVDYREQDFVAGVREATAGHGADVVLDVVGGSYLARNLDVLASGGRIVTIAVQGGARGELDLGMLMSKRASISGSTLRARPAREKAEICGSLVEHVWPLVVEGRVRPVVHERVPMAEAARAHAVLEEGDHVGKVLLVAPGATMGA